MAKYRRIPQTSGGIIVGIANVAKLFGCHPKTIERWARGFGFPLATLPSGHRATTGTLCDLWLLSRLPVQPPLPKTVAQSAKPDDAAVAATLQRGDGSAAGRAPAEGDRGR